MLEHLPIPCPGFEGRGLSLQPAGLTKNAAVFCDGKPVPLKGRSFILNNNAGAPVTFQLKAVLLDSVPRVQVGDQLIRLTRPFTWYEYVWIALPLLLFLVGGFWSGLCGVVAGYVNAQILRSNQPAAARYGLSFLVIVAAVVAWLALAIVISLAFR